MEQVNFFNLLSNVKNFVHSNGFEHLRNVIQWHYNSFFLQKVAKTCPAARALSPDPHSLQQLGIPPPRPPSVICFSHTNLLNTSLNLHISTFKLSFEPSPFSKILGNCPTRPCLLIFHFTIFLPFRKFLMTSLHVICGLPPPIKNPGYICLWMFEHVCDQLL